MKNINSKFISTMGVQLGSKGLSVLFGVMLARYLGPQEYGLYGYIISVIAIFTVPVIAGLPNLIVREISCYISLNNNAKIKGILLWSYIYILFTSLISTLFLCYTLGRDVTDSYTGLLIVFSAFLIPLRALVAHQAAVISAFKNPVKSILPSGVIYPATSIILLSIVNYLDVYEITTEFVLFIIVVTTFSSLIVGFLISRKEFINIFSSAESSYEVKNWFCSLMPFTILVAFTTINNEIAVVILGQLGSKESAGYYRIAMQGVSLIFLALTTVNLIVGPYVAESYKKDKMAYTQELIKKGVLLSSVFSAPFVVMFIFFPSEIIIFVFGEEFLPASKTLLIMSVGQFINIILGSVGMVINMTGNERYSVRYLLISLIINITLLYILVPIYGSIGAAMSVTISLILWNLMLAATIYKRTGLKTWLTIK
ncbi:oligosaccharide flippase family protein [Vibrio splendidus]